ncbi:lysosomal alpha-glucosidase, putative [Ixodes scapularis]|uniref:Lysosomal alpha-glucosidase, putative n=1 Tax=Ixodes scapularis TaxID=6945 RepID=B7Q511_IXOSC|nr:lysosomal alpha-glucosidase, putative [Ixodes scapularis]|eukprot:XP_002401315.1 lysosomal alpha-glucosidase, putative [Ixodes scapularis]
MLPGAPCWGGTRCCRISTRCSTEVTQSARLSRGLSSLTMAIFCPAAKINSQEYRIGQKKTNYQKNALAFPEDPNTYSIDEQFLWGPSLMFSPALYPNQTEVNVYIPAGVWYDVDRGTAYSATSGRYQAFPATFNVVNTLIRGGSIVPGHKPALTTTESRQNPFVLLVAPDRKGTARGHLFWDDGDSINTIEDDKYNIYEFLLVKDLLIISRTKRGNADNVTLGRVRVFGVSTGPTNVSLEGRSVKFDYNETTEVLTLLDLDQPMDEDFAVTWT